MCGIVGILNRDRQMPIDIGILNRMSKMISHRGPDDSGTYIKGHIGLGHRRLSIIDLEAGHQPMVNELRGRVIVYNGEIYNYKALKNELRSKGVSFHTNSDTEVLLNLVDTSDTRWLECLNGMFAFAHWDEKSQTLFLARDRLGIKPLYYVDVGQHFLFASEIKALLVHPKVRREVNQKKLLEYIVYRNIAGCETLFKNIYELPPGNAMILRPDTYTPKIVKFWSEGNENRIDEYTDIQQPFQNQFKDIFVNSVEHRLISDVPLGTYNSGGVDSSLVTAVVRPIVKNELHTFSVGFEEKSHDESKYARIVADKLQTTHHALVINERDYVRELKKTLWHLEEPLNHAHTVQILYLSRLAKEFVTVVLTGEGADEVFAGYPRYRIPLISKWSSFVPNRFQLLLRPLLETFHARRLIKLMEASSEDDEELAINNSRFVPLSDYYRIASERIESPCRQEIYREGASRFQNSIDRLLYYDQRTYLSSLLTRLDKMSMAAGIESRVPFLDFRLVEWSYLIPTRLKLNWLRNKWIIKKVAENWLPKTIVHRKKVGFGVPIAKWMRNPKGLGMYLELLTDRTAKGREYFDNNVVDSLIKEHVTDMCDHSEILWSLLNLELWHREFIDTNSFYSM